MSCFKINGASASELLCKDLKGTEVHLKLLANPASTGLNDQESHEKISVLAARLARHSGNFADMLHQETPPQHITVPWVTFGFPFLFL